MLSQWLQLLWLIACGVATGTYVAIALALVPTMRLLPAASSWALQRTFEKQVDRYMPPTVALSALSGIGVLLTRDGAGAGERALIGLAVLAMAAAAITSIAYNLPIIRRMGQWTEAQLVEREGEYITLRARWINGHLLRTCCAALAFGIAVAISVFRVG